MILSKIPAQASSKAPSQPSLLALGLEKEINTAQSTGGDILFGEPDSVMCDEVALAAIGTEIASPTQPPVASDRPRDVRKGDRWLPWHGADVRQRNA